ncbi:MAG TPA: transposase [Thermoleophilaceae bacterium]
MGIDREEIDVEHDHSEVGWGGDLERVGVSRSEPGGQATRRRGVLTVSGELLSDGVIDELFAGARIEEEIAGQDGLLGQLTKRLVERAMEVELADYLGCEPHAEPPGGAENTRGGSSPRRLVTEHGRVQIHALRDRDGRLSRRLCVSASAASRALTTGSSLYVRGMWRRDISAHLQEIYGVHAGRELISKGHRRRARGRRAWQARPLDDAYPVVFLDALVLKIRDGSSVQRKGVLPGAGDQLQRRPRGAGPVVPRRRGFQVLDTSLTKLKHRGVTDILICCVEGLQGFPEAIEVVFPATTVQTCIVHLIRASLKYVPRRQYDAVVKDLKPIYTAINAEQALLAPEAF